jgi:cytochrome c oxidase cbb3-type subunit 4
MLKFIKHHLDTIHGIAVYPVISFVLFFGIFLLALFYVWKAKRGHFKAMEVLPLSDGTIKAPHHEQR